MRVGSSLVATGLWGSTTTPAEHAIVQEASALAVVTVREGWRQFQLHLTSQSGEMIVVDETKFDKFWSGSSLRKAPPYDHES